MGHARALLAISNEAGQRQVARDVITRNLSVRETEAVAKRIGQPAATAPTAVEPDVHTRAAQDKLKLALGTRVRIVRKGAGGRIEIDFTTEGELQRLYDILVS
jgi:ParB family chromosome partitioning protein